MKKILIALVLIIPVTASAKFDSEKYMQTSPEVNCTLDNFPDYNDVWEYTYDKMSKSSSPVDPDRIGYMAGKLYNSMARVCIAHLTHARVVAENKLLGN